MTHRIATWLRNLLKIELAVVEKDAAGIYPHVTQEIDALRKELGNAVANFTQVVKGLETTLKAHSETVAKDLHTNMAADAKAIALFRQTTRMACSQCGQMTWKYAVDSTTHKILCVDCQTKKAV